MKKSTDFFWRLILKERYKMMKTFYLKDLIFLEVRLIGMDLDIYQYICTDIKHINVLFLENLEIKERIQWEENLYVEYYIKVNMLKILKNIVIKCMEKDRFDIDF